mmetsp:Transcript_5169/g.11975  ORF Transcript_5169/g.11975 Transcript_5169/m.11975 type:complete len:250 (-) Transcript_5169:894-1643(-)
MSKSSSMERIAAKMLRWVVSQLMDSLVESTDCTRDTPSCDHTSRTGSQNTHTTLPFARPSSVSVMGSASCCDSGLPAESNSDKLNGVAARSVSFSASPAPAADNNFVISSLSGPAVKATSPPPSCWSTAEGTETCTDSLSSCSASEESVVSSTATVISVPSGLVTVVTTGSAEPSASDRNCLAKLCSSCNNAMAATFDTSCSRVLLTQSSSNNDNGDTDEDVVRVEEVEVNDEVDVTVLVDSVKVWELV